MNAPKNESAKLKQCSNPKCRKWMPLKEFTKNGRTRDGYQHRCRICSNRARWERINEFANHAKKPKPKFTVTSYFGDFLKTKLAKNRSFCSGDGGYKFYIDQINATR